MKMLSLFGSLVFAYSCKPANKEYQAKIDDSDIRETIEQREQKKNKKGLKIFNITSLVDKNDNMVVAIPIAVSLEIKGRNILEKTGSFLSWVIGENMNKKPADTKIVARIKDLRRNHIHDSSQKVTLIYQSAGRAGLDYYYGKNKYGGYTIRFDNNSEQFPMTIGSLTFVSKKTGGSYTALLVKEVTDTYKLTDAERVWMLGNIMLYFSKKHTDHHRYIVDNAGFYRLNWDDGRYTTIWTRGHTGTIRINPNALEDSYVSDTDLVDTRIHEINKKIKEEYENTIK